MQIAMSLEYADVTAGYRCSVSCLPPEHTDETAVSRYVSCRLEHTDWTAATRWSASCRPQEHADETCVSAAISDLELECIRCGSREVGV
jgi:hypothetical protein